MKRKIRETGLPPECGASVKPVYSSSRAGKKKYKKSSSGIIRMPPLPEGKIFSKRKPEPKARSGMDEPEIFYHSVSQTIQKENRLLGGAYDEPEKYEEQQISNAHLNAEAAILNRLSRMVWPFNGPDRMFFSNNPQTEKVQTVVSLGCGSGWLDRRLIDMFRHDLKKGGRLKLLGIDTHPDILERARMKMSRMLDEDVRLKQKVEVQYLLANLEGPTIIPINGCPVHVPGLSDIDLKKTVINDSSPDLFLAFYLFFWTQDKDAAITAIAQKSREGGLIKTPTGMIFRRSTRIISGEEFPLHITPNPNMTDNFKIGVRKYAKPINIEELWEKFEALGFKLIIGTDSIEPLKSKDEHWIHYRAMEFQKLR
jgi:hypothetical protein